MHVYISSFNIFASQGFPSIQGSGVDQKPMAMWKLSFNNLPVAS